MRKTSFSELLVSGLLTLTLLFGFATDVFAATKLGTVITFTQLGNVELGEHFTLAGTINDQNGKPVANKSIQFALDGDYLGQARSNEKGLFERKFNNLLNAGSYELTATSNATHLLEEALITTSLRILPAEVHIQTIPSIPDVPFRMAGKRFVSDENGLATIMINAPGEYRLEVLVNQYRNESKKIEFARWLQESYDPYRYVKVPSDKVIQVGFDVFHPVGQSFVDLDGVPVDPERIFEFTIRSAQGDMFVLHDGQQRWIPASRVARRVTGLEETKLLYSVLSVTVDGSNVVNQSQQRFYTYPHEDWPISLLLYSLHFSAKDGMFGFPVGKSVNIEFPDGRIENYPLDKDGVVEIRSLARGTYYTEVVGAFGLSNRTPVALSRNQEVNTKIISFLDIGIVGLAGIVIVLGLLFYGRPSLLIALRKKAHQVIHPRNKEVLVNTEEVVNEN